MNMDVVAEHFDDDLSSMKNGYVVVTSVVVEA